MIKHNYFLLSDFVLLEWKEIYGKREPEDSQKFFAEKFDDKAYSVWHGVRAEELTKSFQMGSYLQGVLERLSSARKFMHAMFLIHSRDDKYYTLSTAVICKGPSLIFDVSYLTFYWQHSAGQSGFLVFDVIFYQKATEFLTSKITNKSF